MASRFLMFSTPRGGKKSLTPHGHKKIKDNPYQDYLSVTEQTP